MKEKIKMKLKEKMGGKAPAGGMKGGKKPMGKKEKVKSKMGY
jgi:hypothetical protein